ncbi:hypothetical protein CYLTODRAFT_382490 [Cylindrobasidium torrendii FP15055 ss-10]|uniref:C3H1-type domain-containing protein n=1 Tax=Cylindrobasidium torrendii FP15055 ss-10 TaxID=1314674 RepID=A0A0D7AYM3_9AGAR|nr:hypothetical protein CYLTODRAFT_382490 [Cylindrobasidium torrendii FP15055 ss-10]
MPPKKKDPPPKSSRVTVDKTFGMKNKNKSSKVQKQVQLLQDQASSAGKSRAALDKEKEKALREKAKAEDEKRKKEEAQFFKPAQTQKVPPGVDPKTMLCAFYKAGNCEKGNKCKFSHDMNVGRKVDKKNLYEDAREDKLADTMDKWDEAKLRDVVLSKAGNPKTTTDIVCKFFIEAVENEKYGWFWECPNGEKCMYRHALPPGFMLKSQKKAADAAAKSKTISIEEFLEVERHKLGPNLTPVTKETFAHWKKTRMDKKEAEEEAKRKVKDAQSAAGKSSGMSGRDLFQYNPEWFIDEDGEAEDDWNEFEKYRQEKAEADAAEQGYDVRELLRWQEEDKAKEDEAKANLAEEADDNQEPPDSAKEKAED